LGLESAYFATQTVGSAYLNKGKICYKSKLIKHSGNAVMTIKTFTSTTTLEKLRSKDNVR
jgi:hypothetical protein